MTIEPMSTNLNVLVQGAQCVDEVPFLANVTETADVGFASDLDSLRAQIAEGFQLVGPLRRAVTEYYQDNGTFPADNTDAGADAGNSYAGKFVTSVTVDEDEISITYGGDASAAIAGEVVVMTAQPALGSLSWRCSGTGNIRDQFLPSSCN